MHGRPLLAGWALLLLGTVAAALAACRSPESTRQDAELQQANSNPRPGRRPANQQTEASMDVKITREQALETARRDAELAYRDLSRYRVDIRLQDGNWQVDYELRNERAHGGGPHYMISAETGAILSKRYEQ